MLSRIFLRKPGYGKSKAANQDVNNETSASKTEVDNASSSDCSPPAGNSKSDRSSSKFYVHVNGDESPGSPGFESQSSESINSQVTEGLCNGEVEIAQQNASKDSVCRSDSNSNVTRDVTAVKPYVKPKPAVVSPVHMANPKLSSGKVSPGLLDSPSPPVKIQICGRTSVFPPIWPPPPKTPEIQEGRKGSSSSLESTGIVPATIIMRSRLCPPVLTGANRGSRRSFTTDDADIGLYKKPSFCPEFDALPEQSNAKLVTLRRGKGSDVGKTVNLFEQIAIEQSSALVRGSRNDLPAINETLRPISVKPKLPTKPQGVLPWNSKQDINSKPCTAQVGKLSSVKSPEANKLITQLGGKSSSSSSSGSNSKPEILTKKPSAKSAQLCPVSSQPESEPDDDEEYLEWSDDDFDEGDDDGDENNSAVETQISNEAESNAAPVDKAQKVAEELLKTELAYVSRLQLLDQVFHMEIMQQNRDEHFLPDDVIPQIFSSIKSILLFHNNFLLPQLKDCMENWDSQASKIGQVLKKFAPFLKLYTDYIKNFENATNLISTWMTRSQRFATCLDDLHRRPECGNLTLQHHLLEPIQRVPRYELLLRDYIKYLPPESEDLIHAQEALELVTRAAQHSNTEMRKIEKFRSLLDLKESLGGDLDLESNRELIKEGKITKISARDGDHSERYLFLFSDQLLVCQSLPLKLGLRQQYTVKAKLDIRGMQVLEGNNLETANTFIIKSKQKSIEFCSGSLESKDDWQRTLWSVISDYTKKQHTRSNDKQNLLTDFQEKELGKRAPVWVKDQETTMCMVCGERFGTFKRRHHCRCCGKVVCNKCSAFKAKLAYDEEHEHRVCSICISALGLQQAKIPSKKRVVSKARAALKVSATDQSVLSGYLLMSCNGKTWNRKFFALHSDFALYSFKAHQDVLANTSLPLPGYEVNVVERKEELQLRDFVFSVSKKKLTKVYYFQADDELLRRRWVDTLSCATRAELPVSYTATPQITSKPEPADDVEPSSAEATTSCADTTSASEENTEKIEEETEPT